ncbi:uncharacterized protein F5Z01DRAFT_627135 [Emericellopsis atlantica]|uniref:pH-response regulator protein palC n=1 Tax=Emericellopsis atlantica TaxID=2614577 RepID=A0A9P7ZGV3_9HYPO|nr:uncharacterized protein F5Z01DRAFT_627135 [Emericellopsis atlantica]KAG9251572.1 hypothetical protein F5Z01DRAFT_627135 [Emericellopsis atlantica]
MPYPFALPTTSSFSFTACFESDSHPSLPLRANTFRGVAKDALKKHKRLDPASQVGHLPSVRTALLEYLPYVLALNAGLYDLPLPTGERIRVKPTAQPSIKWRPTLNGDFVQGRDRSRLRCHSLSQESAFVMSAIGFTYVLEARSALQPLYSTNSEFLGAQERTTAISTATKNLMSSASVFKWLSDTMVHTEKTSPHKDVNQKFFVDIAPSTVSAMASLSHAEATLLAVLKDDPYPAAVAQDRNKNDKEWMFKSPEIPKVRALLYARLCLAASEHAARALSLAQSSVQESTKMDSNILKYMEDFRRVSRAKACRFLGIDAELGGQTADGIGWLQAGLQELGVDFKSSGKGLSLSSLKRELSEIMEDRRVDKEKAWGADAGRLEETRVIEMLSGKWNKINDTMNTKPIPSINTLLAKIPSGREIHAIPDFQPPSLDRATLSNMQGAPDPNDDFVGDLSSEDEVLSPTGPAVGAFPGTKNSYSRSASTAPSTTYY